MRGAHNLQLRWPEVAVLSIWPGMLLMKQCVLLKAHLLELRWCHFVHEGWVLDKRDVVCHLNPFNPHPIGLSPKSDLRKLKCPPKRPEPACQIPISSLSLLHPSVSFSLAL